MILNRAINKLLYWLSHYYVLLGSSRSGEWFDKVVIKNEEFRKSYLKFAREHTNYIKLKKISLVVEKIEEFRNTHGVSQGEMTILDVGCGQGFMQWLLLA